MWNEKHFVDYAFKFSTIFLKGGKLFFVPLIVGDTQMLSNSKVLVFISALKKVSAHIANIIRITQITFECINKVLLIYWWWFGLHKDWAQIAVYSLSKIGQ